MKILTFDIEDWYLSYHSSQIFTSKWDKLEYRTERNTDIILQFLSDNQLKATFFFLGYEIRKNPTLLQKVQKEGHELGFHGMFHVPPAVSGPNKFAKELKEGLTMMEDISGQQVLFFRAPEFSYDAHCLWLPEVLREVGILASSSTVSGRFLGEVIVPQHPFKLNIKGSQLLEFPLNTKKLFGIEIRYSGSGYFRMYPHRLLQHFFSNGEYHMLYFHPRDFDTDVPLTPDLPWYRNLMNRYGNLTTLTKLTSLVQHFSFVSLGQAYNHWIKIID